jgi:hypothetical protein
MRVWGWLLGAATMAVAIKGAAAPEQDVRPGTALPPEQPTSEAARYEAMLQGEPVLQDEDSVENRRRFDDALRLGLGLATVHATPLTALYTEVDAHDRLALGGELGLTLWGLLAGGYVRLRPVIWGGRSRGVLSGFTLDAGYRYMQYGDSPFDDILASACHDDCERVRYLSRPTHFLALGAGFEHAFASGWSIRYSIGAAFAVKEPDWRCELGREPVACGGEATHPTLQTFLTSFVLSRAIF